jgi:hypothetical protein
MLREKIDIKQLESSWNFYYRRRVELNKNNKYFFHEYIKIIYYYLILNKRLNCWITIKDKLAKIYMDIILDKISTYNIFNKETELPTEEDLEKVKKILNLTE